MSFYVSTKLALSMGLVAKDPIFSALELHDWLSDLRDVFVKHFSLQDAKELRVVIHDSLPVRLSDRVTFAFRVGSVDEDLTLVEADVESTDNCVLTKA